MAQFQYSAMDSMGKMVKGSLQGSNLLDVEARLEKQGMDLVFCKEVKQGVLSIGRKKLARQEVIDLVFQLEQLTKAGIPLVDALKDLRDSSSPGYFQSVMSGVIESIEGGKTFSEALGLYPHDFNTVFISLIAIGEESGELPKILKDLGETLQWIDELIDKTVKIMIYPMIVGVVILSVTVFLMVFLVPDIVQFIKEMGSEIPLHTRALISTSDFISNHFFMVVLSPFVIFFGIRLSAKKSSHFKLLVDTLKIRAPLVGDALFKIKLARFVGYMALLYSSGITVLRSLEICQGLANNKAMEKAIATTRQNIVDGMKISESFAAVQFFPPILIRMIRVGEHSGNLDESLMNASSFFNREVAKAIDKIEPAIGPLLTVIMASLLGWIMLSVLGPVWDAIGSVGI